MKTIISFDIGIVHLGYVRALVDEDWVTLDVTNIGVNDITISYHPSNIPIQQCKIPHTNEMSDKLDHFFQYNQKIFNDIDIVLIERQPIMGIKSIEQLIYSKFKNICQVYIISPNQLHKWLGINTLSYESRKIYTEKYTTKNMINSERLEKFGRKHDIADAFCILSFFIHTRAIHTRALKKNKKKIKNNVGLFDKFKYTSKK
jgi:hypothetical protein